MIKHSNCSICKHIPEKSEGFWKGGTWGGGDLPKEDQSLKVVGAPFRKASESAGNTQLKKCPKCNTFYKWRFSYEFLVNGTEDEIYLDRISEQEGIRWEKQIYSSIEILKNEFIEKGNQHLHILEYSKDKQKLFNAAYFFQTAIEGHDLSFAIPGLQMAFTRLEGNKKYESVGKIAGLAIFYYFMNDKNASTKIINLLRDGAYDKNQKWYKELLKYAEEKLNLE